MRRVAIGADLVEHVRGRGALPDTGKTSHCVTVIADKISRLSCNNGIALMADPHSTVNWSSHALLCDCTQSDDANRNNIVQIKTSSTSAANQEYQRKELTEINKTEHDSNMYLEECDTSQTVLKDIVTFTTLDCAYRTCEGSVECDNDMHNVKETVSTRASKLNHCHVNADTNVHSVTRPYTLIDEPYLLERLDKANSTAYKYSAGETNRLFCKNILDSACKNDSQIMDYDNEIDSEAHIDTDVLDPDEAYLKDTESTEHQSRFDTCETSTAYRLNGEENVAPSDAAGLRVDQVHDHVTSTMDRGSTGPMHEDDHQVHQSCMDRTDMEGFRRFDTDQKEVDTEAYNLRWQHSSRMTNSEAETNTEWTHAMLKHPSTMTRDSHMKIALAEWAKIAIDATVKMAVNGFLNVTITTWLMTMVNWTQPPTAFQQTCIRRRDRLSHGEDNTKALSSETGLSGVCNCNDEYQMDDNYCTSHYTIDQMFEEHDDAATREDYRNQLCTWNDARNEEEVRFDITDAGIFDRQTQTWYWYQYPENDTSNDTSSGTSSDDSDEQEQQHRRSQHRQQQQHHEQRQEHAQPSSPEQQAGELPETTIGVCETMCTTIVQDSARSMSRCLTSFSKTPYKVSKISMRQVRHNVRSAGELKARYDELHLQPKRVIMRACQRIQLAKRDESFAGRTVVYLISETAIMNDNTVADIFTRIIQVKPPANAQLAKLRNFFRRLRALPRQNC